MVTATKQRSDPSFRRSVLRNVAGAIGLVALVAVIFGILGMIGREDPAGPAGQAQQDGPQSTSSEEGASGDDVGDDTRSDGPSDATDDDVDVDSDADDPPPGDTVPDADGSAPDADGSGPDADNAEDTSAEDTSDGTSGQDEGTSQPSAPTIDPAQISVQVLDGYGQDGGAATDAVYQQIEEAGYRIVARNPAIAYSVTTVLWTAGHQAEAQQVANLIGAAEVREQPGNLSEQVNVHVVVGADRG